MLIGHLKLETTGKSLAGTLSRDWLIKAGESVIVRRIPGQDVYELLALPFCKIDTDPSTIAAFSCLPEGELTAGTDGKLVGTGKAPKTRRSVKR